MELDRERLEKDAISEGNWHTAKHLSDVAPHEYVVLRENPEVATSLILAIKDHGEDELYEIKKYNHKKMYRCLYIGEYKYWYMSPFLPDGSIHPKSIVNRAKVTWKGQAKYEGE